MKLYNVKENGFGFPLDLSILIKWTFLFEEFGITTDDNDDKTVHATVSSYLFTHTHTIIS